MKKIILATAVITALFATQANAALTLPVDANGAPDVPAIIATSGTTVAYITGSSAATPFIDLAVVNDAVGTVYKFGDADKNAWTYVAESNLTPNTWFVVQKRDKGGSKTAITSANGTQAQYNEWTTFTAKGVTCGAPASGISKCAPAVTTTKLDLSQTAVSDAALSDVDSNQFALAIHGGPVANATTTLNTAVATQTFGFVVNFKLRNALQVAEIASGTLAGTCTAGDETEACMPTLTTEQLSSIFTSGRVNNWSQLKLINAATPANNSLLSVQATADKPSGTGVHICSRTAGSGTLATANIKFAGACNTGTTEAIPSPGTLTIAADSNTVKAYHAMTSSGEVEDCLEGLNAGTAQGTAFTGANVPTSFRWAIGILGTERNPTNSKNFRFIKIDGYSPSAKNVAEGKYKFWSELVNVGAMPTTATTNGALALDILNNVSKATQIASVNVNNANFGITGYLGVANNSSFLPTSTAAFDSARPVNPYTHEAVAGGSLNHCRIPTVSGGITKAVPNL